MVLRLIGHYDSPFVRRVGVSMHVLGIPFERHLLSVFSGAEEMRAFNPLVRVPVLVLDDGERLIDSAAILDATAGPVPEDEHADRRPGWLDESNTGRAARRTDYRAPS